MITGVTVQKIASLTGHTGSVYALSPHGPATFFSGGGDKAVVEWDLQNPGEGMLLARIPGIIYSLYTDRNNNRLLAGQESGGIHVISLTDRNEIKLLQNHSSPIFHIGSSQKHGLLFSLSGEGKLGVMDAESLSLNAILQVGKGKLRTCAVNKEESILALGSADGTISLLNLPGLTVIKQWQAHQEGFSVNALTFSPDDTRLLSGSRDAHMNCFDTQDDFKQIQSIPAHNYAIYSIAYSPDTLLLATASRDKTIKIWNPDSFEVLHRIDKEKNEGHKNSVNKIIWHPGTNQLVSASDDRSIMIWNVGMINVK